MISFEITSNNSCIVYSVARGTQSGSRNLISLSGASSSESQEIQQVFLHETFRNSPPLGRRQHYTLIHTCWTCKGKFQRNRVLKIQKAGECKDEGLFVYTMLAADRGADAICSKIMRSSLSAEVWQTRQASNCCGDVKIGEASPS